VGVRVADVAAVLRALPAIGRHGLLAHALDLRRLGMFGFSLGGATAAVAMRQLPAIQAGLDMDGSLYGDAVTTPLARPFLLLADALEGNQTDPTWQSGWRALHDFRREIRLRRSGHLSFTDIVGFIDRLGLRSRYSPRQQRLLFGTIPAPAAITATRQLVTAYFDYFLNHDKDALTMLNAPSQQNRDLLRMR
jgi:dienelactone hydrolase